MLEVQPYAHTAGRTTQHDVSQGPAKADENIAALIPSDITLVDDTMLVVLKKDGQIMVNMLIMILVMIVTLTMLTTVANLPLSEIQFDEYVPLWFSYIHK